MAQTAPRNPLRPLQAWRAIRALLRDPDDTAQVFAIIEALSGNTFERVYRRFRATPTGRRILAERRSLFERLSDRDALRALPEASLGHSYATFVGREQISAAGLREASESGRRHPRPLADAGRELFGARLRDMHDLWHVVTGYERDLLGEAALLAFTFAQTRNPGIGFIVGVAYLRARGEFRPARALIRDAYRRGRRAAWLPAQDWEALLALPLSQVREQLRVEPPARYTPLRSAAAPATA